MRCSACDKPFEPNRVVINNMVVFHSICGECMCHVTTSSEIVKESYNHSQVNSVEFLLNIPQEPEA